MRDLLFKKIESHMCRNEEIVFLAGDVGFSLIESLQKKCPERIINFGISEQSMMGAAAGLALDSRKVFVYSIGNFNTFRCAEQIRNDVAYHGLDVTIIVVGGGVSYGNMGYTHHAIQDYALIQAIPNIQILSPQDDFELSQVYHRIETTKSPKYLRLGRGQKREPLGNPELLYSDEYVILNLRRRRIGNSTCIISTGETQEQILHTMSAMGHEYADICSVPYWGADSTENFVKQLAQYRTIVAVENHLSLGGFGNYIHRSFRKFAPQVLIGHSHLDSNIIGAVGSESYLTSKYTVLTFAPS